VYIILWTKKNSNSSSVTLNFCRYTESRSVSDTQSYLNYEEVKTGLHDYDEIFDDDDGYPD